MSRCKSRHRKCWLVCGGYLIWCYECGAIRPNLPGRMRWQYPVGPDKENPAMNKHYAAQSWESGESVRGAGDER